MNLKEFQEIKETLEKLKRNASKAEGSLETSLSRLKDDFGYSLEEAKNELNTLKSKKDNLDLEIEKLLEEFQLKWKKKLNE